MKKPVDQASLVDFLVDAAEQHAADSQPGHDVGDLQRHLSVMWGLLNPAQRLAFVTHPDVTEVLQAGLGAEAEDCLAPVVKELSQCADIGADADLWQALFKDFPGEEDDSSLSWSDLAPWMRTHFENLRQLLGLHDSPAYVVIQEGGSSSEHYVHTFDTPQQADEFRLSCYFSGSYRTSQVYAVPASLDTSPPFEGFIATLLADIDDFDFPAEEESRAILAASDRSALEHLAQEMELVFEPDATDDYLREVIFDGR